MSKTKPDSFFWFRRDLRLNDNRGLHYALSENKSVQPIFIFDRNILDKLENKKDARVDFIHRELQDLKKQLQDWGSDLWVYYGKPDEVWSDLFDQYDVDSLYFNRDYEPYARSRDSEISDICAKQNVEVKAFKDHVIYEMLEITKDDGDPYTVFTPYKRKWMEKLNSGFKNGAYEAFKDFEIEELKSCFNQPGEDHSMPGLESMGFQSTDIEFPPRQVSQKLIKEYEKKRNFPAEEGTSRLSVHFRFGTISIRRKAKRSMDLSESYLNELIWRDFYSQILANFPHVVERSFREKYDFIEWRNNEKEFKAWCEGRTGYPIVDAGMRQLNKSGYMHNRVRMITASFLTKHLLIDWRWGEAYFAEKLLDYELASNNGGWQWAAGSGTDAAPYFRIFNPYTQREKFDKNYEYIKKWIPEYGTDEYPEEIVEHKMARERCLERYKEGLDQA